MVARPWRRCQHASVTSSVVPVRQLLPTPPSVNISGWVSKNCRLRKSKKRAHLRPSPRCDTRGYAVEKQALVMRDSQLAFTKHTSPEENGHTRSDGVTNVGW